MNDFYDRMASLSHLIFPDWDESIERQTGQIAGIMHDRWGAGAQTVLDVNCGIGTQDQGLAMLAETSFEPDEPMMVPNPQHVLAPL
jgi:hypothetical protein